MKRLDKKHVKEELEKNVTTYNSVCNSCACGGPYPCNQTCKGCKDKGYSIKDLKNIYKSK